MQLIKISPKGQITIPVRARKLLSQSQLLFEMKGKTITLRPIVIHLEKDELEGFSNLTSTSFEFWNNKEDDIYSTFYNNKK